MGGPGCYVLAISVRKRRASYVVKADRASATATTTCRATQDGSFYYSEDDLDKTNPLAQSSDQDERAGKETTEALDKTETLETDDGSGGTGSGDEGNNGGNGGGGGDGGGGDGEEDDDKDIADDTFLNLEEAEKILAQDAKVPEDWQLLAKAGGGLRQGVLLKYLALIKAGGLIGTLVGKSSVLRDRLIVDDRFLFKVLTEVLIDSGCATFAEVKKRGDVFWDEFEFYLSDLVVGIFLDVALVTLLAPTCIAGASTVAKVTGATKGLGKYTGMLLKLQKSLPSAVFEKSIKGLRVYTPQQRIIAFLYKGIEYAAVGFACGLVGQSMANTAMIAKRAYSKSKQSGGEGAASSLATSGDLEGMEGMEKLTEDLPVPPLFRTACVWALFMGLSSNTRYQIVFGLERLVEGTIIAKKVPMIANLATIAIRFANNIYGGEQFIDMARWAGIQ